MIKPRWWRCPARSRVSGRAVYTPLSSSVKKVSLWSVPLIHGISDFQIIQWPIQDYPATPPSVIFSPPIAHPNVTDDGIVSLPYLDQWTKKSTLTGVITSIYKAMSQPLIEQAVNLHAVYEFTDQSLSVKIRKKTINIKLSHFSTRQMHNKWQWNWRRRINATSNTDKTCFSFSKNER